MVKKKIGAKNTNNCISTSEQYDVLKGSTSRMKNNKKYVTKNKEILHKMKPTALKMKDNKNKKMQVKKNPQSSSNLLVATGLSSKTKKEFPTFREKMMNTLKSARFRYLNENIYSVSGREAQSIFNTDPKSFNAYHEGFRQQVSIWPVNPVDIIIKSIKKMPKTYIIADFGCGEAKVAQSVEQKVHSFDLVALNKYVTVCDMATVPLKNASVDVAIFCLSMMGTNLKDFILEANRVLKIGGILKVAEIESRFDDVKIFIQGLQHFGFKNIWNDLSYNLFYFLDFKKEHNIKNKRKLPIITLHPCVYKKR